MNGTLPKKLFLIDGMSLVFRSFFAPMQTALASPDGTPTKAVYIFLRTLRKLLKKYAPDYLAVVFDSAAPTFRDSLFEQYKANRPAMPEDLSVQLPYVRRFCQLLGIPIVEQEGFEADDVIGTLTKQAAGKGHQVVIVSGDEDLFQLVGDQVRVLKPARGAGEEDTLCDVAKVREILGVEPSQVVDWLALTGDPSDNIPGARPLPGQEPASPGGKRRSYIGPKGATELIRRFGTLEKALDSYQDVEKASYRDALRDFRQEALLSRELATIRTDVPLEPTLEQLKPVPADLGQLTQLSRQLGFMSLLREFLEETPRGPTAAVEAVQLQTPSDVAAWLESIDAQVPVAVTVQVEGEEGFGAELVAMVMSDGRRAATFWVRGRRELLTAAAPFLADPGRPKTVHNSKLLRLLLSKDRIELAGVTHDTILYSYLLEPLASSHALGDAAVRHLGRKLSGSLAEAAEACRQLATFFVPEMAREGLNRVYGEIELPLSSVLADMEATGVLLDPAILAEMSKQLQGELADLTRQIYDQAGVAFDIDSPKQLGEILFEKLKLPGGKKLKKSGQYSTEAAVLEALAEHHELPRKIIDYRTRTKLKSTYLDALPNYIDPITGRVHTSFNQTVARTGRLSSSNPNLQNIPIGDELGLRIRSAFVAEPGWRLISADYSQIELRVLAHMSEDQLLLAAFARNEDIHARTAQEIFGVPAALQTHEHRRLAKAINYGVIYGLSSFGLAGRTGTSKTEAQQYINAYFERYGKVKEFLDGLVEEARQTGRVRTLFGRMRPIPEIRSQDPATRNRAEREAMNTPLQGTAADLMKLAMVKLHARLRREKMQTRMILTVHDELVFEAPESELDTAREIIREEMENAYLLRVPLRVDIGVGRNWKEAK